MGITSSYRPVTQEAGQIIEDNQPNVLGTYRFVQGNTATQLKLTLSAFGSTTPYDLTGAIVTVYVRNSNTKAFLVARECFINPEEADQGIAYFVWAENDIDDVTGVFEGEIEIQWADGTQERLFDIVQFVVREQFS